jgi:hypothetical protein
MWGSTISSDTFGNGNAGEILLTSKILNIDGKSILNTGISSDSWGEDFGNAGDIIIKADVLKLSNWGIISSDTLSYGGAGNIKIKTNSLSIVGAKDTTTEIAVRSGTEDSSGKVGYINISATNWIHLLDGGSINAENEAIVTTNSIGEISNKISIESPEIFLKNSEISTNSTGNVAAANIDINFSNALKMNQSSINTTANTGNGGAITVNGGELIYLKNSGFKTTVSGEDSNGGDISVKVPILVMDTGLIQANAVSGNGGNINLALQALIPSANKLIKGGESVDWDKSPSNVIQAASQTGLSGTINNSAPQMNLSGVLANINNNFDTRLVVSQDYCAVNKGSSLSKKGRGALPLRAKDFQVY